MVAKMMHLRAQRESYRTSQDVLWLHTGWKSNSNHQEVRAEFIEGIEREQVQIEYRKSLLGVWGFY